MPFSNKHTAKINAINFIPTTGIAITIKPTLIDKTPTAINNIFFHFDLSFIPEMIFDIPIIISEPANNARTKEVAIFGYTNVIIDKIIANPPNVIFNIFNNLLDIFASTPNPIRSIPTIIRIIAKRETINSSIKSKSEMIKPEIMVEIMPITICKIRSSLGFLS